jgi:predicted DNA-binding transcriptional regulator AlpA
MVLMPDPRPSADDLRIMLFKEWCEQRGLSYPTGRRLLASGQGPRITKLSARLYGVQARHDREWLDSRTSKARSPPE